MDTLPIFLKTPILQLRILSLFKIACQKVNHRRAINFNRGKLNYSSVAYLSSQFKKVTGLTPSAFKKEL
jgi:YesN/AraC family two-component response regulator